MVWRNLLVSHRSALHAWSPDDHHADSRTLAGRRRFRGFFSFGSRILPPLCLGAAASRNGLVVPRGDPFAGCSQSVQFAHRLAVPARGYGEAFGMISIQLRDLCLSLV